MWGFPFKKNQDGVVSVKIDVVKNVGVENRHPREKLH